MKARCSAIAEHTRAFMTPPCQCSRYGRVSVNGRWLCNYHATIERKKIDSKKGCGMMGEGDARRIEILAWPDDMAAISEVMELLGCDMSTAIRASVRLMRHARMQIDRKMLTKDE